jgi:hypothetical protein
MILLSKLRAAGHVVLLTPSLDLSITPKPCDSMIAAIREHKAAIVVELRTEVMSGDNITEVCLALMRMPTMPATVVEKLDALLSAAITADWADDDQIRLTLAMTEAYARWGNAKYKAAIWGGKTWKEAFGS